MRRVVVDAVTVRSWFDHGGPGREMRREYESGRLIAIAPPRLHADLLAGAGAGLDRNGLGRLADALPRIGVELVEPPLALVASWLARGLHADVAPYAALAEHLDLPLVAGDERLLAGAGSLLTR